MSAPYTGRCVCDAVHYRVNGEPLTLYACHCTDCQKRTGAAFNLALWVKLRDLEVTKGETTTQELLTPKGTLNTLKACGKCGVRLWSERAQAGTAIVRAGTLDDTKWLEPVAHMWTRSKQPWVKIPEGAKQFEGQPGDFKEMFALWQQREKR